MDLAPVFVGTVSLSAVFFSFELYREKTAKPTVEENRSPRWGEIVEWSPLFLYGLAFILALYPAIASSLTPEDTAHASIDEETVVAVSMISQFVIIVGICARLWTRNKIVSTLIGIMFLVGLPTVVYSF